LKKPSAANSASKLPEELIFFLDRSLGKHIVAAALREAGEEVVIHDEQFQQNTPDTEWLTAAGQNGWVVLTKDERIRYRIAELAALRRANARAFVLTARKDLSGPELAGIFVSALPRIRRLVAQQAPPFIAKIARDGTVALLEN